jgi:RNA polymerase sigma-70 factor (ECF subfamily)
MRGPASHEAALIARRTGAIDLEQLQAGHADGNAVTRVAGPTTAEPEARTLERDLGAVLRAALAELPADARVAVVLRDLEGMSTGEAGGVAGVRPEAFKSRLHRGRVQLRARLGPYLERA